MGVCSAANSLLNCGLNVIITGCKIRKRSGLVCLFIEDYNADLDLCFRFFRLLFQRSKHLQRLFFHLCARGLIQHEYHIRCQRFLCTRQRQRHIGSPGVRIQRRCGLGSGNVPLNGVGAAGGFFRKGPYAVQRKVFSQLLLAGQNRTVILFPAVKGERAVHAVLRAGHAGRNVCDGVFAANQHTLCSRCGITCRKITCYFIGKSKQLSMCGFQRNRTFKILYRFKDFIIYSGFISRCSVSRRCIGIQFTVFFAPAIFGFCILKAVIIPIGNRKVVRGQNQVAAHFCCFWKIQLIATARINIIADGLRGIVVQGAVLCDLDGNILQSCNTAAITAAVVIGNCNTCCNIQDFVLKRIIFAIYIFDIDCTTVHLCAIAGNAAAVQRNTAPVFA